MGMLTLLLLQRPDKQPEELHEGELIDTKDECGCDKRNKKVLEEVMLAKSPFKRNSGRYFLTLKVQKVNKIANPNLGQSSMIHQEIEKMLIPYHKLSWGKKASAVQITFDKLFCKIVYKKTSILLGFISLFIFKQQYEFFKF